MSKVGIFQRDALSCSALTRDESGRQEVSRLRIQMWLRPAEAKKSVVNASFHRTKAGG